MKEKIVIKFWFIPITFKAEEITFLHDYDLILVLTKKHKFTFKKKNFICIKEKRNG